nr:nonribosomal peptide synthetase vlms [Quercus suber]
MIERVQCVRSSPRLASTRLGGQTAVGYGAWEHVAEHTVGRDNQTAIHQRSMRKQYEEDDRQLTDENLPDADAYWRAVLKNCNAALFPPLPPAIVEPMLDTNIKHRFSSTIKRLHDQNEVNIILAAWAIITAHRTQSQDVVFGLGILGDGENGVFESTLHMKAVPVRFRVVQKQSLHDFLKITHRQDIERTQYVQTDLQRIAQLSTDARYAGDFQTLLVVQPTHDDSKDDCGKPPSVWDDRTEMAATTIYGLTIQCMLSAEGVQLVASFDSRVLEEWQVRKMLGQFEYMMRQLAEASPSMTVGDVEMLTPEDRRELWEWNRDAPAAVEQCVHDLVAAQVRACPGAPAVYAWDGELTYSELDTLSTRLAHRLVELGVLPEMIVPLCFEKSMWTTVAVLGVLKAGGAFLLLDPTLPTERLGLLCRKVGASIAVTSRRCCAVLENLVPIYVTLDSEAVALLPLSSSESGATANPGHTAYVIFTSGSTGEPKGVVIEHSAASTSCLSHGLRLGFDRTSRVLQFSAYTFDACIMELVTTLMFGGCICLPTDDDRLSGLETFMNRVSVNTAFLTPAVARMLKPERLHTLHTLIIGGEPINLDDLKRWKGLPDLVSAYGPTECTVYSTLHTVKSGHERANFLGKGVGTVTWIVDPNDHQILLPPGSIGELLLESAALAREYLDDKEKTREAFPEDPAWLLRGSSMHLGRRGRLYKTGDLVRYNENGTLTFTGRKDTQVKIRGQRVELSEVEHHVRYCFPQTKQIVAEVISPGGETNAQLLTVFLLGDEPIDSDTASTDIPSLRLLRTTPAVDEFLGHRLPQYMVPTIYFVLQEVPMTTSGKTDRRRLRQMGESLSPRRLAQLRMVNGIGKSPPVTEAERHLQELWAQTLGVERSDIGRDDSFFILGGDSIAAMRLVSAARHQDRVFTVADIFRHPKLADLASQVNLATVTGAQAEKIAAFSLLDPSTDLSETCAQVAAACGVDATEISDVYPCSPLQEGLVSLSLRRPGDYVAQNVLQLSADLHEKTFREAWEQVVGMTDILRTRMIQHNRLGLLQVVLKDSVTWTDTHGLEEYLSHDRSISMELGQPFARYAIVRDGTGQPRWFVWTVHHALYDGWSLRRVLKAVKQAYVNGRKQEPSGFKSFIAYLRQQDQSSAEIYWRDSLMKCAAQPFPRLPSGVQRPVADATAERQCRPVIANKLGATTSTIIRATWAIVTSRHTDCDDVVYGATVYGRHAPVPGIEEMIGPTIATIPVRVRVAKNQLVYDFVAAVQQQTTEMIPYEQTGLRRIAQLSTDARHACDFQTLLVVQPADNESAHREKTLGVWDDRTDLGAFTSYGLMLQCMLAPEGVQLVASFDSRVLEEWQVQKLLGQFEFVMRQLTEAGSNTIINDVEMLTPEDRRELWEWNRDAPAAVEQCVHDLVTAQVHAFPGAPAVCAWDGELTYSELDTLSTRLAHRLIELGVLPETIVPLCFEKSVWTTVAVLGVLKAGGAFLLLDPSLPTERLRMLCRKVGATVALTSGQCRTVVEDFVSSCVALDKHSVLQLPPNPPALDVAITPQHTAYVIFTSGSTGEPKGCRIEHRSSSSAIVTHAPAVQMNAATRTLQFGAYSFAGAIAETLMTLANGGCLCVPSEEERRSALATAISRMGANWAFLTATVLSSLSPDDIPSMATLCIGGEPLRSAQIAQWAARLHLRQTYGSSETSGYVSSIRLTTSSSTMEVGKAATGRYWIVDPENHDRLAPLGAVGEVLIEGPVLGREYIGESKQTAATFIQPPTWRAGFAQGGFVSRFYVTGDLGRYQVDGALQLIGRKDTQVKLRGQRVELGEIEHQARLASSQLRDIVVELIRPSDNEGNEMPMLACFLVVDLEQVQAIVETIQERLESTLPQYMVPSVFAPLRELPVTRSRKTDRRRLRSIGTAWTVDEIAKLRMGGARKKDLPCTAAEQLLRGLWAEVLGIASDDIGRTDSFFRLGGDSIAAMRLAGAGRRAGVGLTVADIFHHPKLCDLAAVDFGALASASNNIPPFSLLGGKLDAAAARIEAAAACAIDAALVEDMYICSPLQEGLLSLTSKRVGDYVMQNVLQLRGGIDLKAFRMAWEEVVRKTSVLRTRIVHHSVAGLLQVVLTEGIVWEEAESLDEYLSKNKERPMGLGQPLTRYALVEDKCEGHVQFVWTAHHAIFDGWSLPRLVDMVIQTYQGQRLEEQADFRGFIKYLDEQNCEDAVSYWRTTLAGCTATLFPAQLSSVQQTVGATIVEHRCHLLHEKDNAMTASTLIRASWAIVVSRFTREEEAIYGTTVTGRNAPVRGIEDMLGPTIATVPVRVAVQEAQLVCDFVANVQQQATEMIPYEQTGLQRIAQLSSDARYACDFQTLLVVQPANSQEADQDQTLGFWHSGTKLEAFATYGLMLQCMLDSEGMQLVASFDSRVLEEWQVRKLLGQFEYVMRQLAEASPSMTVGDVEILTPEDRRELWEWNRDAPAAVEQCVHDLVAAQVRACPEAPAVYAWDGELTYSELDTLSTRLAHRLVELGVLPETVVPLCFEKSMWTTVAVLGVLKAGGAFLLLDPTLPTERLGLLCRKVGASIAVTSRRCCAVLEDLVPIYVTLDSEAVALLPPGSRGIGATIQPGHTAYVIFTSGSTGEPKGCRIEHRSSSSAIVTHAPAVQMNAATRTLQFGAYSFAGAIAETLMTLVNGGCLCVPSEEERRSALATAISRMGANWAFLTATVLSSLSPEDVPSLATLCVGGEPLWQTQVTKWAARIHLRQTYGSSETSGYVSSTRLTTDSSVRDVGKAATGRYWIVDPENHDRLAPLGAVGEVLVEGPIIGREYINEPEQTATMFFQPPVWRALFEGDLPESKFYLTGDLGRQKSNGALQLIGRKDTQVKLRGQRVELGEIEHQVRLASSRLQDVVVELVCPHDEKGNETPMLACFLVFEEASWPDKTTTKSEQHLDLQVRGSVQAIQERLADTLPQYMVPSIFTPLRELPVTRSRKTDRRQLQSMAAAWTVGDIAKLRNSGIREKEPPSTAAEQLLRGLWAEVLGIAVDNIGRTDSFFRLGGDSVAAMRLAGAGRRAGVGLTVADIFHHPKLCDLASIDLHAFTNASSNVPALSLLGLSTNSLLYKPE